MTFFNGLIIALGLSQILFGVSLEVDEGECVSLLGRNGVGKTTTLRSIMGLTAPRQGSVRYRAQDITGRPTKSPASALALCPKSGASSRI